MVKAQMNTGKIPTKRKRLCMKFYQVNIPRHR